MKRNPKTTAGLIGMSVMTVALIAMLILLIPKWQEADREANMTPSPLPPVPASVMAVTPDPSLPTSPPVLRNGSRGQEVKELQSRLYSLGYYQGTIDGEYGTLTAEAVRAFQKANGLEEDGIAGAETRTLLFSPEAKPYY